VCTYRVVNADTSAIAFGQCLGVFLGKVSRNSQEDYVALSRRLDTKGFDNNTIHVLPGRPVAAKDAQWLGQWKVS
jgi:hypothetical protein